LQKRNNKMLVPFLIAGELFVLFISYIISGVWKEGMDVITLLNKVNDALDHPFKNYWTEHSLKAMIVGTLIYAMAVLLYITSRRNLMHGKEYGTASFANIDQVNKAISDKSDEKNRILSKHVRMSTDTKVTKLNNNMLVIGGSGAGKTFYIVKPNIMQMLPKGSFIATDPKGGAKRSIVKSYGTIATNN